jgi:hypothetical protein
MEHGNRRINGAEAMWHQRFCEKPADERRSGERQSAAGQLANETRSFNAWHGMGGIWPMPCGHKIRFKFIVHRAQYQSRMIVITDP